MKPYPGMKPWNKQEAREHFVTLKVGPKFDFGNAYNACKCPNPTCGLLLDWKETDIGVYEAFCCGQVYEMYCEHVTFAHVGQTDKPNPSIRQRRQEPGRQTVAPKAVTAEVIVDVEEEPEIIYTGTKPPKDPYQEALPGV